MEIFFKGPIDKTLLFKAVALANRPSKRAALIRLSFAAVILVIFVAYLFILADRETTTLFENLQRAKTMLSLPFLLIYLLSPWISAYLTASKIWRNTKPGEQLMGVISNRGICYRASRNGGREILWERFAKKKSTTDLIVLLTPEGVLSYFPRHYFQSDADWEQLTQWANSHVVEAG